MYGMLGELWVREKIFITGIATISKCTQGASPLSDPDLSRDSTTKLDASPRIRTRGVTAYVFGVPVGAGATLRRLFTHS